MHESKTDSSQVIREEMCFIYIVSSTIAHPAAQLTAENVSEDVPDVDVGVDELKVPAEKRSHLDWDRRAADLMI